MKQEDFISNSTAFVFELDDVLYPEKDYWLQVYYLFAQFIEYGEQTEADGIIRFMEESYRTQGHPGIFERTIKAFNLPEKYRLNFDLLEKNARLPLKLLLFAPVLDFLKAIHAAGKSIFLLVDGDPAIQLNKIRQMEWNGLEQYLRVYFLSEMNNVYHDSIAKICNENELQSENILFIGKDKPGMDLALPENVKFLLARNIL